jgi:hypothetical protein
MSVQTRARARVDGLLLHLHFSFTQKFKERNQTLCDKVRNPKMTFVLYLIDIINVILKLQINLQNK